MFLISSARGKFCGCTSRPAHRPVLAPWYCSSPRICPSCPTQSNIASIFATLDFAASCRAVSACRTGSESTDPGASRSRRAALSRDPTVRSCVASHAFNFATFVTCPTPPSVASASRAFCRSVSARAASRAAVASA